MPQALTVTEHFQLGRFGQVVVSSGGRLLAAHRRARPRAPEAQALQAANDRRRLIIDDSTQAQNPDPIVFGRGGQPLSAANTLRGGDTVTGAVGVLTYTWGGNSASPNAFRLRPLDALGGQARFEAANPRPAAAPEVGGTLQVAGMNVLNYFNSFTGCTLGVAGGPTDCRGADDATELERQAAKTVAALTELDAEVVGAGGDRERRLRRGQRAGRPGRAAWTRSTVRAPGPTSTSTPAPGRSTRWAPTRSRSGCSTSRPRSPRSARPRR